jgi:hypothetical protein
MRPVLVVEEEAGIPEENHRPWASNWLTITCGCLLAHGRWFSPGTPDSSTTKTGCHNIAEILLKVVLNTKHQIKSNQRIHHYILFMCKIVFNQNIFGMFMSLLYICIKM